MAEKRDIWRPAKASKAGTRDNEAKIRDVPGNTGRLATLPGPRRLQRLDPGAFGAWPLTSCVYNSIADLIAHKLYRR